MGRRGTGDAAIRGIGLSTLFALVLLSGVLGSRAQAQIVCPPGSISGTTPLPSCIQALGAAVPAAQAAIFGSQGMALESTGPVLDRIAEQRRRQQEEQNGQASAFAAMAYYTKAPRKADPITPALTTPAPVRPAFWVRGFGDYERRDGAPGAFAVPGGIVAFDQRYTQRSGGVLAGGDLIFSNVTSSNDALILGAFAGYSAGNIRVTGGRHEFDGPVVGAYATYLAGAAFLDMIFKVDFNDFRSDVAVMPVSADARNYSFLANVGYKIDMAGNFYLEPTIGVEHLRSDFSNQINRATTIVTLEDSRVTRGRFGARVGTSWIQDNLRIEPSLLALGYYYFEATAATVNLGAAGGAIVLPTDEGKFRGELQGSINVFNLQTGVSGFVRSDLTFGDDYFRYGFRAGLRVQK
jgi:outer membrane autotransporter protein